jgi:hypothetical protein
MPRIIQLRKERLGLKNDMQSLAGTCPSSCKAVSGALPEAHEVCKRLTRVRKALRDEAKKEKGRRRRRRRRRRDEYYDIMPKIEVDKQVDQLLDR